MVAISRRGQQERLTSNKRVGQQQPRHRVRGKLQQCRSSERDIHDGIEAEEDRLHNRTAREDCRYGVRVTQHYPLTRVLMGADLAKHARPVAKWGV